MNMSKLTGVTKDAKTKASSISSVENCSSDALPEPDWSYWKAMTKIKLWEAVVLIFNIDPWDEQYNSMGNFLSEHKETHKKIKKCISLLKDNYHLKEFFSHSINDNSISDATIVTLSEVSNWAKNRGYPLSKALEILVEENKDTIASLKIPEYKWEPNEPRLEENSNNKREDIEAWISYQDQEINQDQFIRNKITDDKDIVVLTKIADIIHARMVEYQFKSTFGLLTIGSINKIITSKRKEINKKIQKIQNAIKK